MKSLLLDFGSSFVKYSFYDSKTRESSELFSSRFPEPVIDTDGLYEVDHRRIDDLLLGIMNDAKANECTSVFICVQMHGYLLKCGEQFSNYISWKDKRGHIYLDSIEHKGLFSHGTAYKANLPRLSLRTYPSLDGREFFTLGSYIAYQLTGNNVTHITDACAGGLYRAEDLSADNPFEGLSVPTVTREMKPCGKYKGMDIFPPMGDHQVSFLGVDAQAGRGVLNLGTAAQLSIAVDKDAPCFDGIEYRPYFEQGKRLATLSGFRSEEGEAFVSQIKNTFDAFGGVRRIMVSGGATDQYAFFERALRKLGYRVERYAQTAGNEGLKRIANCVDPLRGTMLSEIEFVNFPLILKKEGLDFFIIDNEHGIFENKIISALAMNARHAGVQAIVRLPDNDRTMITKLADSGVMGFLLPMTNRGSDIEKVIEYAKYSPEGKRGISTTRAHTGYGVADLCEYMKLANQKMKIYAQIETREGVDNLEEILKLSEVEGIFIGPNDLSCDYGCMGDKEKIKELITLICGTCVKIGKPCGIITADKELIKHALLCGCSMVSSGSEINMLKAGAQRIARETYL